MVRILIFIVVFIPALSGLYSQDNSKSEPLLLPGLIFEKNAELSTSGGIKQFPSSSTLLSSAELDSLNSLEKKRALLLPVNPLPDLERTRKFYSAYIRGDFGSYSSPLLEGGWGTKVDGYSLYGNAGFNSSSGHIDGAGYSNIFGHFQSDYIADDKFWLFGGSKTRTSLDLRNRSFNLYAREDNRSRNLFDLNLKIDVDGNYEGYLFETGASFETAQLSDEHSKAFDNAFRGYLAVKTYYNKFLTGINAGLNLHNVRGNPVSYSKLSAFGSFIVDKLTINLDAGFQGANNSGEISRGGFLFSGNLEYRMSSLITVRGTFSTGLRYNSFYEMLNFNPYLADTAQVDFRYELAGLRGGIFLHPNVDFGFSATADMSINERLPVYISSADTGAFDVNYSEAAIISVSAETFWKPDESGKLTANLKFVYSDLDSKGKLVPYISPLQLGGNYRQVWYNNFGTQIGISYIGERYEDIENLSKLKAYIDFNAGLDYAFKDNLKIYTEFNNILNSEIYVWKGYKDRNLFMKLGVLYQF